MPKEKGRPKEAEQLYRDALDGYRRVFGAEHPDTLRARMGLADRLADEARYDDAEKIYMTVRDIQARVLGPNHPGTAVTTYNIGCTAAQQGHKTRHSRSFAMRSIMASLRTRSRAWSRILT